MHWWSTIGFENVSDIVKWNLPTYVAGYPRNLFFLPLFLVLNHLIAVFEVIFAIDVNSLGIFSHGSHTVFNGIMLTGLVTSLLIQWRSKGRYSLTYIATVAKVNFVVGLGLLVNSIIVAYLSIRDTLRPPPLLYGSLYYIVPVPALIFNLVGSYLLLHGNDDAVCGKCTKAGNLEGECARTKKMSATSMYWHMLANAVGSIGTIGATILVQSFHWQAADGVCAGFIAVIMFGCAVQIIKESIGMIVILRTQPNVFVVSYHANDDDHNHYHCDEDIYEQRLSE